MNRPARVLVSWYTDPRYIPPFKISDDQVTVGPKIDGLGRVYAAFTPEYVKYDLKEVIERQGINGSFDLVVVFTDASLRNMPDNLRAFGCPVVLCVGDTHHMDNPLQRVLGYSSEVECDFLVSSYNRQHLHWFTEAGHKNTAWIPGLVVQHLARPQDRPRKPQVVFIGFARESHIRRRALLEALEKSKIPMLGGTAGREAAADLYCSSVLSFNASLNGDVNLRNFEILSAGGCLLTDRLSLEAGFSSLLEEGKEWLGYDSAEEMVELAARYLRKPADALRIAQKGHRSYVERFLPEQQADRLLNWVFNGILDPLYQGENAKRVCYPGDAAVPLAERVHWYERMQKLHLTGKTIRVLLGPDVPLCFLTDIVDLVRVETWATGLGNQQMSWLIEAGLQEKIKQIDADKATGTAWDILIGSAGSESLRDRLHPRTFLSWMPVATKCA